MQLRDWINIVQVFVALVGVGIALYIALRREKTEQQNEDLKRAERYAEIFSVPLAIADIVVAEMESLLKELIAPYWESGWGAPPDFEARCDRLIAAFTEIPLRTMPTKKSVEQLWHIQKRLQIAKNHLMTLALIREELKTVTSKELDQAKKALEEVGAEADALRTELVRATSPSKTD
jgi:hypothetical protein